MRNVFDFDAYDKEARESVEEVLHKHGMWLLYTKCLKKIVSFLWYIIIKIIMIKYWL